jgi:DNA-binding transcriptional ArsR family regulator
MGLAKTEMFTDQQNEISLFSKVFGHPARVSILQHLFKIDSCVCGDLVNEIGLAQPTISQHLKELKHLGLIKGNLEGTSVCNLSPEIESGYINIKASSIPLGSHITFKS